MTAQLAPWMKANSRQPGTAIGGRETQLTARKMLRIWRQTSLRKVAVFALVLALPAVAFAQAGSADTPGINSGDYNIHQTIEAGYRGSWLNGNKDTYDTFENLGSGLRLFDYSLQMRSLDHKGILFDSLTFSNFGYGGDPNDVTRLRIQKTTTGNLLVGGRNGTLAPAPSRC